MSTHDYIIDNQSAPALRADLNNVLAAIVTQNANATAPTVTYANMIWYDTSTDILKKRNEANSAWINLGTINEALGLFTPSGQIIATLAEAQAGTENTHMMTPLRVADAVAALGAATTRQVFTASGTWTKPTGLSSNSIVVIEAWGGGGGGASHTGSPDWAGGGGGGGYAYRVVAASDLAASIAVTIGAGGTAGATGSNANGGLGGTTSFGTYLNAYGGGGGSHGNNTTSTSGGDGAGPYGTASGAAKGGYYSGTSYILPEEPAIWGGAGGGGPISSSNTGPGAGAVMGGGGGGASTSNSSTAKAGGTSIGGGAGGASARNAAAGAGVAPAGGGGASTGGSGTPGAGARGEVRITVIK